MNKFIGMGRLVKDPELIVKQDFTICRYTIAIDSGYGEKKETNFLNCVAFGKAGEFAHEYFTKGLRVLVEGRVQIKKNDDKCYTSIIIENQEFADAKKEQEKAPSVDTFDDEIPF